jgi:hypothetical protein
VALAQGAVQLPLSHLSVRAPWHDTDWTGRVCSAPSANHACTILKNVKGKKDADTEEEDRTTAWSDLDPERVPPCVFERGGFMRPSAFQILREHAYSGGWTKSHEHFAPTVHHMPAYSFEATPYRWVMRDEAAKYAAEWGIKYDAALEEAADRVIQKKKTTTWVQDHRNQLALLDSFFSSIQPQKSLVFVYAKDAPVLEERAPGTRVLLGCGHVESVGPVVEWDYSGRGLLRSIMWERSVGHTIRPTGVNGFLLPYHAVVANPELQGEDLEPLVAFAPGEHFDEFSYVTERVGHDGAIAALLELARVVDLLPAIADGPWSSVAAWLSDRLADAWELRGPYPGLGAALSAAGLERGGLIAHRVVESLDSPAEDPWPALFAAIDDSSRGEGPAAALVGRMSRKAWARVASNAERMALLRLLARFPLTAAQARRMFDGDARAEKVAPIADAALLENPYLMYELDRGRSGAIDFATIDRGLFPRDAASQAALAAAPLPEPVTESADDRRVRAACVSLLETAATDEGHSVLDEPRLRKRLASIKLDPICDPTSDLFDLAAAEFPPHLVETPLARGRGRGWQLERLSAAAELIERQVKERLTAGVIDLTWPWRERIDAVIDEPADETDPEEKAARSEKADALTLLARSRVVALVGPAGTGKRTMLKALCTHRDVEHKGVLLLAPTGKARVQLGDKVGAQARTLAQHLRRSGRWDPEYGYRVMASAKRDSAFATVIVDEASMLTEEMLAALFDSLEGVERLVLCGDHRQLPPIGAGRPFADIIGYLRGLEDGAAGGVAELTIGRRQKPTEGKTVAGRDDLAVASLFSVDGVSPAADEAFSRVLAGEGDGTIRIVRWDSEEELHERIVEFLESDSSLKIVRGDSDALKRSLGARGTYKEWASFDRGDGAAGVECWQMLSPVKSRPGGVIGLNQLVRRTWRTGDAAQAVRSWKIPPPLGGDEILFHDKVMCGVNHRREAQDAARQKLDAEVANGEIGMAVSWWKQKCIRVEFSTQPKLEYTFWVDELNGSERETELLELAYAITVHKAQGSQFGTTIVVAPNPCPLLSPELLYTALTRQRERVVLFVQGDPHDFRLVGAPSRSETARRLTRLFRAPDPFQTSEGDLLDGSHVHRTARGEMVRSKSEVIVANLLHAHGIEYAYERELVMPDDSKRSPDFTIPSLGKRTVYWEHLGMLDKQGYRADWEAKKEWYESHGVLPWNEGGGTAGVLVYSSEGDDGAGIDSVEIEALIRDVFEVARP